MQNFVATSKVYDVLRRRASNVLEASLGKLQDRTCCVLEKKVLGFKRSIFAISSAKIYKLRGRDEAHVL